MLLVCRSFSEGTDPYVVVDSVCLQEEVSSESSYAALKSLTCVPLKELILRSWDLWLKDFKPPSPL